MGQLFERAVILTIGDSLRISARSEKGDPQSLLRVQFKIVRTTQGEPNTADITIYNLNKDNRSALQEKNIPIILQAGYSDNASRIFSGSLKFTSSVKNGSDWITTVQSGDGIQQYQTARINTNLKGPVEMGEVLKTAGKALGLKLGNLNDKASQGSLRESLQEMSEGIVLSGSARKVFSKVVKMMGYSWSVQDEGIQILGPNETIAGVDPVLLTAADGKSTGLIGSPEVGEKGIVQARSLLQPDLLPGRRVKIVSKSIDGFFKVDKVVFIGDTWGNDWYSDIEAKPL